MVDQVEAHTQNTIQRSLRQKVTETIERVRSFRHSAMLPARINRELGQVASDLAWMRTMTSSHTNFANRFFPIRPMAHLSLNEHNQNSPVNELNMTPQEMVDAMFPFPAMDEVIIGVVDLTDSPDAHPDINRRLFPDEPEPERPGAGAAARRMSHTRATRFRLDEQENVAPDDDRNVRARVDPAQQAFEARQTWTRAATADDFAREHARGPISQEPSPTESQADYGPEADDLSDSD